MKTKFTFSIIFILIAVFLITPFSYAKARMAREETQVAGLRLTDSVNKINLGKPVREGVTPSDYGTCKKKVFKGIKIAYLAGNNPIITDIYITSNKYKTVRGITVGSTVGELEKAYGKGGKWKNYYFYCYDGNKINDYEVDYFYNLMVTTKNKKITEIRFFLSPTDWSATEL